jgi:F420-0:gamma-glutamyl ligase
MKIKTIKTRKLHPPKDDLYEILDQAIKKINPKTIIVITSKIVAIAEGRCIKMDVVTDKDQLIAQESELYLPRDAARWTMHTITNNLLSPAAGIDESNSEGYYILLPQDPQKSAQKIWKYLSKKHAITDFGLVLTDSRSVPLRRGIIGVSLAHFGFTALRDYRGTTDLFGRELKVSQSNIPDSLAAAAVLEMGEGSEQTPIAVISDVPYIQFTTKKIKSSKPYSSFEVPMEEDIFSPFLISAPWKKGGRK